MHFPKGIYTYGDRHFRGKCAIEKQEAVAFFKWLRLQHPHLGAVATHIRNEGKRSRWQTFQHKREGLVTGASDIIIPCNPAIPSSRPCIIELKRRDHTKSTLSEEQENYLLACKAGGAFVCVALGAEAAQEAVGRWIDLSRRIEIDSDEFAMERGCYAKGDL